MFSHVARFRLRIGRGPTMLGATTLPTLNAKRKDYSVMSPTSVKLAPVMGKESTANIPTLPEYHPGRSLSWGRAMLSPIFRDATWDDIHSWRWNTKNVVEKKEKLYEFLETVVPAEIPRHDSIGGMQSRDDFMGDIDGGIKKASMAVRLMPYIMGTMNWNDPANCPIFRQFVTLRSVLMDDHPQMKLDPLDEEGDRPAEGIVHRYPDKALFLPTSVCPVLCAHCTRAHAVGPSTDLVMKKPEKLSREKIKNALAYIESQEGLHDIVISGGDAYYLAPQILEEIGDRLIGMKNIERFRVATRGLAVVPNRFLDDKDAWTDALFRVADKARKAGKHFALHTQFNHPNEISWITEKASLKLSQAGITVRNQTVLLRGVNDNVATMSALIRKLAQMLIQPYYVYQCDMVIGSEHLRTPLQTILDMESELRGSIAGFYMPNFVVDLPGGGGKRLACSFESYDRDTGVSTFRAPVLENKRGKGTVYRYYDPLHSLKNGSVWGDTSGPEQKGPKHKICPVCG